MNDLATPMDSPVLITNETSPRENQARPEGVDVASHQGVSGIILSSYSPQFNIVFENSYDLGRRLAVLRYQFCLHQGDRREQSVCFGHRFFFAEAKLVSISQITPIHTLYRNTTVREFFNS